MRKRLTKFLSVLLVAFFASGNIQAGPLNATNIGGIWTTTPVAEASWQALQGFRGAFTPINIGMAVGTYVIISTIGDGVNALRAQMAAPLTGAQAPAGWTNSETPPATAAYTTQYKALNYATGGYVLGPYSTGQAACEATGATTNPPYYYGHPAYVAPTNCGSNNGWVQVQTACATGYTLSGGTCNLTTPAAVQWPSDGKATVQPVNGVLTPNSRDPDNSGITAGPIDRIGTDSYGNPVHESITSNTANGIDYRRDSQSVNPTTGEPTVQRDQYSTNSSGQVTSVTSNTYNNSTVSNVSTTNNAATQTDTSALAKESTLTNTNTKLDILHTDLTTKDQTAIPTGIDAGVRTFHASTQLVFTALRSYFPTLSFSDFVGACPTFSQQIPFLNVTLTIDQFCTFEPYIRPVIHNVMLFLWPILGLIIILRA